MMMMMMMMGPEKIKPMRHWPIGRRMYFQCYVGLLTYSGSIKLSYLLGESDVLMDS